MKKRDDSKRIASLPRGEKHWNWTEKPSKLAMHKRLYRSHGKASDRKCVDCEKQARDWSNETGVYSGDIKDYVPRCRSCHVKKDGNKYNGIKVWKSLPRNKKGLFLKKI